MQQKRWSVLNIIAALIVLGATVILAARGIASLPPFGPTFNPGTGIWNMAEDAKPVKSETLHLKGLQKPVQVSFDANGTPYIHASTDHDLFMTIGYLQAKNRLFQMDLMRREGEGLLSAVVGKAGLSSDEFEDQLGLLRTAQAEWKQTTANNPARQVILAYTQGVNAVITKDEQTGNLPYMFKMLNYRPALWQPVDTLVIQGVMTQTLSFTTAPLDYALLAKTLGYQRTMQWFPVVPTSVQSPYDPGPYQQQGITSIPAQQQAQAALNVQSTLALLAKIQKLPQTAIHYDSNSNNWAVNGPKSASGSALMAGDPHLKQTLPSIWYQMEAQSPNYQFSGVSIPGLPVILIGQNQHISWSITNTQNQSTLYYQEKTSPAHPNEYYWNGAWRPMTLLHYRIPVKNGPTKNMTVKLTVHGPIMTQDGQTMSVWWAGASGSPDLDVMLNIIKASNYPQFKSALRDWVAPTQNFVYADDQGNIGLISAGYYPQVKAGQPWLPLSGTGGEDVVGTIPYNDIPQIYDPPDHFVFSANQRPVSASYPYYIGTSLDAYDPGYRADEIYRLLSQGKDFTVQDMEKMQNNTIDYQAQLIVPKLVATLTQQPDLSPQEKQVVQLMSNWHGNMSTSSVAATVWTWFWSEYIYDTFNPWFQQDHVPQSQDKNIVLSPKGGTAVTAVLSEDLAQWVINDPTNAAFSLPDGTTQNASAVMTQAFSATITNLTKSLGNNVSGWTYGKVHSQVFPSLTNIRSLGTAPRPSGGDPNTIDASYGATLSSVGPSWRFIMDWGTHQGYGIYPGGQSENPLSPWYDNQINAWWKGEYYPMYMGSQPKTVAGTWLLEP